MSVLPKNEELAATAFSRQSKIFDEIYGGNTIIRYKRERVRLHVQQFVPANSFILELNSGTGEDAAWFARQGHRVHATDIAAGMQEALMEKIHTAGLEEKISTELISFTQLGRLKQRGPYDMIFSNFAGLNCTGELDKVLASFSPLLRPGGLVTLVIMPGFCLWEFLLLFKGRFRTAFRRIFSRRGVDAHVEGVHFKCWYYDPSYVIKRMRDEFELLSLEGLCSLVPPSYMEGFAEKHPGLYTFLKKQEDRKKSSRPWRSTGDYYIITLRKK